MGHAGRQDCPTSPATDEIFEFPGPTMTRDEMMSWFAEDFDMTEPQVVALVGGAHSLGRASVSNSGYHGSWIPNREDHFDNELFIHLRQFTSVFFQDVVPGGDEDNTKFQWVWEDHRESPPVDFMLLNTDVELAFDIDVEKDGEVGRTTCALPNWNFPSDFE